VIEATGPAATRVVPRLDAVERTALEAAAVQIPARYAQTVSPTTTGQAPSARLGQRRVPGLADPWITALAAARTRFAVTGDGAALLHTVDEVLALTVALRQDTASRSEDALPASAESAAKGRDAATLASALARCLSLLGPTAGTNRISWPMQWLRVNEWRWRSHEAIPIAWAHWRVTGDTGLALWVLGHILDRRPGAAYSQIELTALRRIAEMGPAARKLAPLLQECLDRNERVTGGGWRGIALDDEVQRLASAALATMNIQR
jgi:hypothetical protein